MQKKTRKRLTLLKNFNQICQKIIEEKGKEYKKINLFCQDESRFGLFTRNGKGITAKGIKPICKFQQIFKSMYYSPITGDHFELEFPQCNGDNFQIFLNEFSKENEQEFKIILLDNGACHKVQKLIIPNNIQLLFIPPYSPELNPSEKIWWKMKRAFTGKLHKTLDEVSDFITNQVTMLSKDIVKSICGFEYIFSCPYWTKI